MNKLTTIESKIMVAMMNKRATMIANQRRISRKWDKKHQSNFETVLLFFHNATEEEMGMFEKGEPADSPEQKAWSEISVAKGITEERRSLRGTRMGDGR